MSFVTHFIFCFSKLLSNQQHYDWGLRELRTVLSVCGKIMRQQSVSNNNENDLLTVELGLVATALKTNTLCKLTCVDGVKFEELVRNIFCGVQAENNSNVALNQAIEETFRELGYQVDNRQVR